MASTLEEPPFEVMRTYDGFEVRRYAKTVQARVQTQGSSYTSSAGGFQRVAAYIFGRNEASQRIAMTAPVHMWEEEGEHWLAFTMPLALTLERLPSPIDSGVRLMDVPASDMATLSFSGRSNTKKVGRLSQQLTAMVTQAGLRVIGSPMLAVYDNPNTTLPFSRRNEILLPVQWLDSGDDMVRRSSSDELRRTAGAQRPSH